MPFSEPAEALTRFRAQGGTVVLITNAPRPNGPIREQLDHLGVPRSAYDDIVTSGDSTVALIAERGSGPFYHIGPERDLALLEEVRSKTGQVPALSDLDHAAHVICSGLFDDATETPESYDATYAAMRERGLDMICANPDVVVHVGETLIFCAGALAERYEELGGTVLYAGKPHRPDLRPRDRSRRTAARDRRWTAARSWPSATACGPTSPAPAGKGSTACSFRPASTGPRRSRPKAASIPRRLSAFLEQAPHRPTAALADLDLVRPGRPVACRIVRPAKNGVEASHLSPEAGA